MTPPKLEKVIPPKLVEKPKPERVVPRPKPYHKYRGRAGTSRRRLHLPRHRRLAHPCLCRRKPVPPLAVMSWGHQ